MLQIKTEGNIVVVSFDGVTRFNSTISQDIKEELSSIIQKQPTNLILNLEGIKFIDSSAFGTLVSLIKLCKTTNSNLKLCNTSKDVTELINVMQLNSIFEIHPTIESCKKSFS